MIKAIVAYYNLYRYCTIDVCQLDQKAKKDNRTSGRTARHTVGSYLIQFSPIKEEHLQNVQCSKVHSPNFSSSHLDLYVIVMLLQGGGEQDVHHNLLPGPVSIQYSSSEESQMITFSQT